MRPKVGTSPPALQNVSKPQCLKRSWGSSTPHPTHGVYLGHGNQVKMMASPLRSGVPVEDRQTSVRVHNTNISIAIWKMKVDQQGFSFFFSFICVLSFIPRRDRSNNGLRCLTSKFRHSNLIFSCHPTMERHTAERHLQHPTSFSRDLWRLEVRSYLPVPQQDPLATCPARVSLDGADLGADRPVIGGYRLKRH